MPTRKRHPATYTIPLLGLAGLVASGLGCLPGTPAWVWLAVLMAGLLLPLAGQRARARRFDATERRRNEKARKNLRIGRRSMQRAHRRLEKRMDARLASVLTPEQCRQLVEQHNAMAVDLNDMKRKVDLLMQDRNSRGLGRLVGGMEEAG